MAPTRWRTWAEKALTCLAGVFRDAVRDGGDRAAREQMAMAATFAGLGFGQRRRISRTPTPTRSPGGCATTTRRLPGGDGPASGMAVALTAPEAFASPSRPPPSATCTPRGLDPAAEAGLDGLPTVLTDLMRDIGLPSGLAEVGYGEADVDDLVAGAVQQQRLLATAPRSPTEDLASVFRRSMEHW